MSEEVRRKARQRRALCWQERDHSSARSASCRFRRSALTTNQGIPIADNQNSLKAGLRGPTLLEDFILREKITHFDHERIPERIVHARGSAAHGFFECYKPLDKLTRASIFAEAGKRTPVFVRFSTVARRAWLRPTRPATCTASR